MSTPLVPVRWNFIKSPTARRPYKLARKLLEVELANSKARRLSDLEIEERIKVREKTKRIIKQKQKEEATQRLIVFAALLVICTIVVYFFVNG